MVDLREKKVTGRIVADMDREEVRAFVALAKLSGTSCGELVTGFVREQLIKAKRNPAYRSVVPSVASSLKPSEIRALEAFFTHPKTKAHEYLRNALQAILASDYS